MSWGNVVRSDIHTLNKQCERSSVSTTREDSFVRARDWNAVIGSELVGKSSKLDGTRVLRGVT